MSYADRLKALLTPPEKSLFSRLKSPILIQDYLDTLPVNFADTYRSPREMIRSKASHCAEGALFAAAVLAYHGHEPLLMDMKAVDPNIDVDHVVALYKVQGYWGAISKTNYPVLRFRDPIYRTPRELAATFFHEYFLENGRKTMRAYSAPFDLSKYSPEKWVTARGDLEWLIDRLDASRHFPLVPKKNAKLLRRATKFEIKVTGAREWKKNGTRAKL